MLLCVKKQRGNFRVPFMTEAVGVYRRSPPCGISSMKRSQMLCGCYFRNDYLSVGQELGQIFTFITHPGE